MEDLQHEAAEENQRNDLEVEGEEEVIDAVEDVKPEVEEVSIDEKHLSFDDNGSAREEEACEEGPMEEAEEVSDFVSEVVEPVQSLPEAVTSTEGEDDNNGSPTVAAEEEQQSSSSMDLPETGSVLPLVEVVCEEFPESTLSNADENSQTATQARDVVDLEGTDKTQESADSSEMVANENVPQVEVSNGNHAPAETPKTTADPAVISVTKRTSFLGCCGFFEVLRRSNR